MTKKRVIVKEILNFRVPVHVRKSLEEVSSRDGISVSDYLRSVVDDHLRKHHAVLYDRYKREVIESMKTAKGA